MNTAGKPHKLYNGKNSFSKASWYTSHPHFILYTVLYFRLILNTQACLLRFQLDQLYHKSSVCINSALLKKE